MERAKSQFYGCVHLASGDRHAPAFMHDIFPNANKKKITSLDRLAYLRANRYDINRKLRIPFLVYRAIVKKVYTINNKQLIMIYRFFQLLNNLISFRIVFKKNAIIIKSNTFVCVSIEKTRSRSIRRFKTEHWRETRESVGRARREGDFQVR